MLEEISHKRHETSSFQLLLYTYTHLDWWEMPSNNDPGVTFDIVAVLELACQIGPNDHVWSLNPRV